MKLDSRRLTLLLAIGLILVALVLFLTSALTPPSVTVRWSTASELNTAGFNVLRGDTSDGPFTRVNPELIPAANDPLVGGSYIFTDTGVSFSQTYYYRIEEVEFGGSTSLQPDLGTATPEGIPPWLTVAGIVFALVLIAALVWLERPRRAPASS